MALVVLDDSWLYGTSMLVADVVFCSRVVHIFPNTYKCLSVETITVKSSPVIEEILPHAGGSVFYPISFPLGLTVL
jgi:hypothetical protein